MSRIVDARSFATAPDWPMNTPLHNYARATTNNFAAQFVNEMIKSPDKAPYAGTLSASPRGDYSPWPVSSGELASLVDLGLSDDQIARYFGVEQVKVSALRAYYGLVDTEHPEPNLVRNLIPEDECCTNPAVVSDGQC